MKPSTILIAVVSGLASALLFAGLVLQSTSAISFALAAPIPIAIASLGWGSVSGFIASAVAGMTIYAIALSVPSALTLFGTMALPMAVAGHLAGLARPTVEPMLANGAASAGKSGSNLDWYPLGRVLFAISAMAIAACLFLGWLLGYDPDGFVPAVVEALGQGGGPGMETLSETQLREFAKLVIALVPYVQPALLTVALVSGLYLGAAVVRVSGRLPRPKDDIPSATHLPKTTLLIFGVALAVAFIGGTIGLVAAVVVGALGAAFTLVGLASLHRRTRGRPGRGLVLFTSYAAILLLSFPIVLFMALGLFETWRGRQGPSLSQS
ncbi:MAG TPA: hypothetical protein ENH55_11005 [Aurantimonas coralicida]|uniref:DUF2232 domain-containing protein n=2 Tax=root TaxID=1 RepID=A0A9C9NFW1_9HYPH|nr:hypothetical protein [Aurantimonas coralicida]HEU01132.1 hypothetical protein [Aurantimonas coralicida]